jgi:hypothetical protein
MRGAAGFIFFIGGFGLLLTGAVKFNVLLIILGVVSLVIGFVILSSGATPAPPAQESASPTRVTTDDTEMYANVERRLRGMGLSEKEIAQRLETIKAGIESLSGVKITPAMAAWAQQELGKQVPESLQQQTVEKPESTFKHITGRSLFYRCPKCNVLLQKRSVEGIENAVGFTSCSMCNASFSYADVYHKGLYDVPEVEGKCSHCAAVLRGPANDLLGKTCPSCGTLLPSTATK